MYTCSIADEYDLEGSFEKMKLPPARPTSKDYGAYLDRLPSRRGENLYEGIKPILHMS